MNKAIWLLLLSFYMSSCMPTGVADADFVEHEKIVSLISGNTLTGTIVSGKYKLNSVAASCPMLCRRRARCVLPA